MQADLGSARHDGSSVGRASAVAGTWVLSWFVMLLLPAGAQAATDPAARGLALFSSDSLVEALPFLEQAAAARPPSASIYAWLAETYQRLDQHRQADSTARLALSLAPCSAHAHQVLAGNFNPQYSSWSGCDAESSWVHLLRGVQCDSTDGNIWMSVWPEAMRRGDRTLERAVYRRLLADRFFPPPVLAYNRWMLARLPARAVLLVNGDLDTYPSVALQQIEGLRPDVAIVNVSLLSTDWYRRVVRDRYGVPMPFGAGKLDALEGEYDESGRWIGVARPLERGWQEMLRKGILDRPLAYSISLELEQNSDSTDRLVLKGAYYLAAPWSVSTLVDTAEVWRSLRGLSAADFIGPWTSPQDRSPVRRTHSDFMVGNLLATAYTCSHAVLGDRPRDALAILDWAVSFATQAEAPPEMIENLREVRNQVSAHVTRE